MKKLPIPLTILISFNTSLLAIQIDGFSSATNDRFANNSSFVADAFDLSGVGISNNGRWATMVSEKSS